MPEDRELPKYRCHKVVHALEIAHIDTHCHGPGTITPAEEGYAKFVVSQAYMTRHCPQVGGYYVVYEDGLESYSSGEAFEEWFTWA